MQEITYRHFKFRRFLYRGWVDELFETGVFVSIVASAKAYLANEVSNTLFSLEAKAWTYWVRSRGVFYVLSQK